MLRATNACIKRDRAQSSWDSPWGETCQFRTSWCLNFKEFAKITAFHGIFEKFMANAENNGIPLSVGYFINPVFQNDVIQHGAQQVLYVLVCAVVEKHESYIHWKNETQEIFE